MAISSDAVAKNILCKLVQANTIAGDTIVPWLHWQIISNHDIKYVT